MVVFRENTMIIMLHGDAETREWYINAIASAMRWHGEARQSGDDRDTEAITMLGELLHAFTFSDGDRKDYEKYLCKVGTTNLKK